LIAQAIDIPGWCISSNTTYLKAGVMVNTITKGINIVGSVAETNLP
jgi:hypothetical protein